MRNCGQIEMGVPTLIDQVSRKIIAGDALRHDNDATLVLVVEPADQGTFEEFDRIRPLGRAATGLGRIVRDDRVRAETRDRATDRRGAAMAMLGCLDHVERGILRKDCLGKSRAVVWVLHQFSRLLRERFTGFIE